MSTGFSGMGVCDICGRSYVDASTCPWCTKQYLRDVDDYRSKLEEIGISILPIENWQKLKIIKRKLDGKEIAEASAASLIRHELDAAREYSQTVQRQDRAAEEQKQKEQQMVNQMGAILRKW